MIRPRRLLALALAVLALWSLTGCSVIGLTMNSQDLYRLPVEGAEKALSYIRAQENITVEEVPDYHG